MSVYIAKDKQGRTKSPYYQFDFKTKVKGQGRSQRFHGSTGQKTRRAAQAYEDELKRLAGLGQLSSTMTIDEACERYWNQIGQHGRAADDEAKNLEIVSRYIGAETLLVGITAEIIADAAERRLNDPIERMQKKGGKLELAPTKHYPKPSTVNRQLIEPLRRVMKRARSVWGVPIDPSDFDWGELRMKEAAPRTREMSIEEELRFWQALRSDYHNLAEMFIISGRRRSDWIELLKFKVDRTAGTARFPTRKRKQIGEIVVELSQRELEIINEEWERAPDCSNIFTYVVATGKHKGERRPVTVSGFRMITDRAFAKAGLENFRRHDWRHTFASRALRGGKGDLRMLMHAMDHQDVSSTIRYTHLLQGQTKDMRDSVKVNRQMPDNVTPIRGAKS